MEANPFPLLAGSKPRTIRFSLRKYHSILLSKISASRAVTLARLFYLLLVIFVSACSTAPSQPPATPSPRVTEPSRQPGVQVIRPGDLSRQPDRPANPAVDTLLARADTLASAGNSEAALAAAERALRMAPRDPRIYLQLASLRLQRGEHGQAEQLALKGLSLGPDDAVRDDLERVLRASRST